MFNLQGSELIIILLLALVVLGPEKLPDAMRKAGQFYAELKKMSTGFQTEFRSVINEPLKELRETANTIRDSADFTKLQNNERPEKPKSAEMVAAPGPDAASLADLPFQPGGDDPAGDEPVVEPPADVAPGDQEPFASVVLTNRAIVPPTDPDGATDAPATETTMAPVVLSGIRESSADATPADEAVSDPTPSDEAASGDPVDPVDPVERSGDRAGTESSE